MILHRPSNFPLKKKENSPHKLGAITVVFRNFEGDVTSWSPGYLLYGQLEAPGLMDILCGPERLFSEACAQICCELPESMCRTCFSTPTVQLPFSLQVPMKRASHAVFRSPSGNHEPPCRLCSTACILNIQGAVIEFHSESS